MYLKIQNKASNPDNYSFKHKAIRQKGIDENIIFSNIPDDENETINTIIYSQWKYSLKGNRR